MTDDNPYQLPPALLDWDAAGAPHSAAFGDIYFSRDSGIDETDYVFLQQNRLAERWRALDAHKPGVFVIGETGFGTGLNFLAAWQLWRDTAPASWRLHFLSAEQYPLSREQLAQALAAWPSLSLISSELLAAYPPRTRGFHTRRLPGNVTLQLIFDDAAAGFNDALDSAADLPTGFAVDAWFLDGFAPAKNPGMWTEDLFAAIARLSKTGSSFATFTAAGSVKRGLREADFAIEKVAGFGHKREMLRGLFIGERQTTIAAQPLTIAAQPLKTAAQQLTMAAQPLSKPARTAKFPAIEYWAQPPAAVPHQRVVVIGGGLAGTSTARALAQRGWPVTLLDAADTLGSGASGNPQGILYTKLSPERGTLAHFALASYLHALDHYRQLQREGVLAESAAGWCGVLQFETDPRLRAVFADQGDWVQALDAGAASAIAGCAITEPALWFARAGWLRPAELCAALAQHPLIDVRLNCRVADLRRDPDDCHEGGWRLSTTAGEFDAGVVVIATANNSIELEPTRSLPLRPIRGQITKLPPAFISAVPRCVICHEGYLAPETDDGLTIGATFDLDDHETRVRSGDHQRNLQSLQQAVPGLVHADACNQLDALAGRVGFRCTTPDYLPIVGAVADVPALRERFAALARNAKSAVDGPGAWLPGLYINVGHGSRGLTSTPISAELLAALICGEPRPLPRPLLQALSPARFAIRDLIRGQQSPRQR